MIIINKNCISTECKFKDNKINVIKKGGVPKFTLRDGFLYTEGVLNGVIGKLGVKNKPLKLCDPETKEFIVLDDGAKELLLTHFKSLLLDM